MLSVLFRQKREGVSERNSMKIGEQSVRSKDEGKRIHIYKYIYRGREDKMTRACPRCR